jgi:hypothetical protein
MPDRTPTGSDVAQPADFGFVPKVTWWSRLAEFALGTLWAVFAVALAFPPSWSDPFLWFGLPFGTLMATHFLRRAFDSSPRLVVDTSGILDKTSFFGGTLAIPWEDVLSVHAWGGGVEIEVRDPADLRRRAGLGRRLELFIRRILGRKAAFITPAFLGVSPPELARELQTALHRFERAQLGFTPDPLDLPGRHHAPEGRIPAQENANSLGEPGHGT